MGQVQVLVVFQSWNQTIDLELFEIVYWRNNLITLPLLRPSNLLHTAEYRTVAILFLPVLSKFFGKGITCIETWLNRLVWKLMFIVNKLNNFCLVIARVSLPLASFGNLWFLLTRTARYWWIYWQLLIKAILFLQHCVWYSKYRDVYIFLWLLALGLYELMPDFFSVYRMVLWAGLYKFVDSFDSWLLCLVLLLCCFDK